MNIKNQIRAEIERRLSWRITLEARAAYNNILRFLDTLPEQPTSGELEQAASASWADYEYREHPQGLYSSCYQDGFIAGAEWQKAKMPEGAVEGIAEELYNDGTIHCTIGVGACFQPGQEVYVIKKED